MNTKLVNSWKLHSDVSKHIGVSLNKSLSIEQLVKRDINLFKKGESLNYSSPLLTIVNEVYDLVKAEFSAKRWVTLSDNIYLDKVANGFWTIRAEKGYFGNHNSGRSTSNIEIEVNQKINDFNSWTIPTYKTLMQLTRLGSDSPFSVVKGRPAGKDRYIYNKDTKVQGFDCDEGCLSEWKDGYLLPFTSISVPLEGASPTEYFLSALKLGFIPQSAEGSENAKILANILHNSSNSQAPLKQESVSFLDALYIQSLTNALLTEDCIRCDIAPYHKKNLYDTELGHWSLWQDKLNISDCEEVTLSNPLVARDPKSSINDGVVAIDFGTKSTVVVYQKDNVNIHPMRIGTGDLSKEIASHHYENPTIMEFINLESFISAYNAKANKPYTRWKDLTISHTAQNSMQGSESSKFNTFLDEIKQWAGDKNRKLKIVGQQGKIIDLPPFLELTDDEFNPLEIYAYYLGLYINNLNNGIFMDYILSFPVTYEMPIRDKIIESFKKGLKKSLPAELGEETINELTVTKGASEPAAYALTALQQYGFEPEGEERVFYSVFDFGGGTTDFDFGIYSEPTERKDRRRFDYVIEHFGAGGDKYLGGENLLELLAFEVFKKNKTTLLEKSIQFEKHPEKDAFAGSEQLLSNSQEARMNTKQLCIALRPFWEEHDDFSFDASGEISVTLTDINGIQHSAFALDVDEEELNQILLDRIERGVENFFDALRLAFSHSRLALSDIESVKIFLAGNSSQSSFVNILFKKHIALQHQEMGISEGESRFELFAPLGADKNDVEKPTGKTGVAFGLIESREGGSVKVIDHNITDEDVRFKYYLGENRKKKFKPLIDREVKFNQWNDFIDAYYDTFEIFFTDQPSSSSGQISISDSSIKKKVVKLDVTDEDALVYVRAVSPTAIEYVVANEEGIANEQYLNEVKRIEL